MSTPTSFAFLDLRAVNRVTGWLLLPPMCMTLIGIGHLLFSYALLTGLPAEILLAHLPVLHDILHRDNLLRITQISLTLAFILFFCLCWLYVAMRNLNALCPEHRRLRRGISLHWHIWSNVLMMLGLMQALWRDSTPDDHADRSERWLVHWWGAALIGANACKLVALVVLSNPDTVGAWREGSYWMLTAYCFYVSLFLLTWRMVRRLEVLQRARWRHRNGVEGRRALTVGAVP